MDTRGQVLGDVQDWLGYLRDVIARPDAHPEAGALPLATLEEAARGTAQAAQLADAALSLLENGTDAERAAVQGLAVHEARDAVPRLRALLARPELPAAVRAWCASELLAVSRNDPAGLTAIRGALANPGERRSALLAAARHLPDWPSEWIRLTEPDDMLLLALWKETPAPRRRAFIEAVVAAGPDHHHALIAGARHLVRTSRDEAAPLMKMLAPYLPEPTSGEIVIEAMVGSLRANRKDPRQAELAERLLRRHDIWPKKPGDDE
jgi:hypothetical protein